MSLLGIRVTPETHEKIRQVLGKKKLSLQEWLSRAVERALKDEERKR